MFYMSVVKGYCDNKFKELENILKDSIVSGYEIGASVAVSYNKEMIVDLYGGFKMSLRKMPGTKILSLIHIQLLRVLQQYVLLC